MTRKERHIRALRLAETFLAGDHDARPQQEVLEAVQYALGAPCPPWWAEHVYDERAIEREHREEVADDSSLITYLDEWAVASNTEREP